MIYFLLIGYKLKDELRPIRYDVSSDGTGIWVEGWFHKWTERRDSTGYTIDYALIEMKDGGMITVTCMRVEFLDR